MALEGPIGERIRIYRKRRGLSQQELAGLVHRSESWLSQVERGIRSVDKLSVLIDVAKVLKVNVETLSGQPFSLAPNGDPNSTASPRSSAHSAPTRGSASRRRPPAPFAISSA